MKSSLKLAKDISEKEEELRENFNLEVVMTKLERGKRRQELYTEMLSEIARQAGKYGEMILLWSGSMR